MYLKKLLNLKIIFWIKMFHFPLFLTWLKLIKENSLLSGQVQLDSFWFCSFSYVSPACCRHSVSIGSKIVTGGIEADGLEKVTGLGDPTQTSFLYASLLLFSLHPLVSCHLLFCFVLPNECLEQANVSPALDSSHIFLTPTKKIVHEVNKHFRI